MFLLDTNVVSELRRTKPHGAVLAWIRGVDDADLSVSAVTLGELQAGVEVVFQHFCGHARQSRTLYATVSDGDIQRAVAHGYHGGWNGRRDASRAREGGSVRSGFVDKPVTALIIHWQEL